MVLGFPIARVEISKEKSVVYHPEYKGVRLDIYAQDEEQTCYNVEADIITVRWIWICCFPEETMRIFRRRMSFLSVTLIRLEIKNINIRSAISARRRARSILEMRGIPFS